MVAAAAADSRAAGLAVVGSSAVGLVGAALRGRNVL